MPDAKQNFISIAKVQNVFKMCKFSPNCANFSHIKYTNDIIQFAEFFLVKPKISRDIRISFFA